MMKNKIIKSGKNCLFINCLGRFLTLILICQKGVFHYQKEAYRQQATLLVTNISILLEKQKLQLQDINEVYFLRGYGSIMGYHAVGTFVNVLALLSKKLRAFSLENHIWNVGKTNKLVLSLVPAFTKEKYYAAVCYGGKLLEVINEKLTVNEIKARPLNFVWEEMKFLDEQKKNSYEFFSERKFLFEELKRSKGGFSSQL